MDNVTAGFIGFLVGLIASFVIFCFASYKTFSDGWDEAYYLGYKDGADMMLIENATKRKEAEVKRDD